MYFDEVQKPTIKIDDHKDIATFLVNDCPCPSKITKDSFATYRMWNTINTLNASVKNKLLQKTLDAVNDTNYDQLRGAIACLVAAGASVDQSETDNEEICALARAASYEDYPMAEFLLQNGADPNRVNYDKPLLFWLESYRFVKLFVKYKLDPHAKDDLNNSIFHWLTVDSDYPSSLISYYFNLGVDIHHKNENGDTPLMHCALHSSDYDDESEIKQLIEKAKLFIKYGISITETNNTNHSVLDILADLPTYPLTRELAPLKNS
ncbi:hypothetical protein Noda2021_10730 [Candidatus Dependentiae bacterium Noda2021]|nr:hypothetical protein Noda2021_10730 [Candidatus Dependentiae bacterium Noda2021]